MSRSWVYTTMTGDSGLVTATPGGIHQSRSIKEVPALKPYIMYRYLADTPRLRGDDSDRTGQRSFMVMVHDVPGSYVRIDSVLALVKALFSDVDSPADDVIRCTWTDTSEDFSDEAMGTILKWHRFRYQYKL